MVLDFTQMVLAVRKHLEMAIIIILNNPEQPLLMQFFQKFTLWGSPCSCPTPWCLWGWTSPRWSWMSGKTLNQPSFTCWTTFASTTFPKNQSLGMSGLRSSRNLLAPPTLIRAGNLARTAHFWTLGVKPDPTVPHTWGLGHRRVFPRGGELLYYIYRCNPFWKSWCVVWGRPLATWVHVLLQFSSPDCKKLSQHIHTNQSPM